MANEPTKLFWDSCVFDAYLYEQGGIYDVGSIEQFLKEVKLKPPPYIIYTSSFVFLEVLNSKIKRPVGSMTDFIKDFVGQIIVIDPNPNIMQLAGRLRDIPYKKKDSETHVLDSGDAVMLATALYMDEGFGVTIDEFHTFDNDKKKRKIPILTYEQWCEDLDPNNDELAKRVRALKRRTPKHPMPELALPAPKT